MNAKIAFGTALLLGSLGAPLAFGSPAHAAPMSCASGYQLDARGDCQPVNGYMDERCPGYSVPGPSPFGWGYRCDPLSPRYF